MKVELNRYNWSQVRALVLKFRCKRQVATMQPKLLEDALGLARSVGRLSGPGPWPGLGHRFGFFCGQCTHI